MNKIVKFEIAIPEEWYHVLDSIAQRQIRTQNNVVINILYKYLKANDLINDISMTDLINIVHDAEVALSGGSVNVVQPTHIEVKQEEVHRVVESKREPEGEEKEREEDDVDLDAVASKLNSIKNEEDNNDDEENKDIEDPFAVEETEEETEESIPEGFIDRLNTYIGLESAEEKLQFLEDVGWDQNILNKALEIYDAYEKDPDTWEPYIENIDNGINTIDEVYKHVVEMQEAEDSEDESDSDEFSFIGEDNENKDNEKEDNEEEDNESKEKEEKPDEDQLLVNLPKADGKENNKKPSISDLIDQTVKKLNNN